MIFREATGSDVEKLIALRIDFLNTEIGVLLAEEETKIRTQLKTYFPKHIGQDFFAVFAEINGTVVSTAFLAVSEKPANLNFITGKTGSLLNVMTYPQYRRHGIAAKLVGMIIQIAEEQNISYIELSAMADGKRLYQKLGFKEPDSEFTRMKLQLYT